MRASSDSCNNAVIDARAARRAGLPSVCTELDFYKYSVASCGRSSEGEPSAVETRPAPILRCRKRPFRTRGRGRRPASAAVCRIPCLMLCLAYVARKSMARRPMLASRQRSALFSLRLGFDATVDPAELQEGENLRFLWHLQVDRHQHPQGEKPSRLPEHPYLQWPHFCVR